MNTQDICLILEHVDPKYLGYGKKSENTEFLIQIDYVRTQKDYDNEEIWNAELTEKGIKYLRQNKPESDYFKLHA
jgi:hypothetical protein